MGAIWDLGYVNVYNVFLNYIKYSPLRKLNKKLHLLIHLHLNFDLAFYFNAIFEKLYESMVVKI